MKIKKVLFGMMLSGLLLSVMIVPVFASTLLEKNWRVYNAMPATAKFWDINKALYDGFSVSFPVQRFLSPTSGSFAVYLLNNYNFDLTDKTITAAVNWTLATTTTQYVTRGDPANGAYVRLEFQDVASGPYTSNDYWWNTGYLDLNTVSSGTLTGDLSIRSQWTNLCGQSAIDEIAHPGPNCVGGTDPAVSPYDGFTQAMKNVKQIGLSFGNSNRYASGVALDGGTGTFTMSGFTITQ